MWDLKKSLKKETLKKYKFKIAVFIVPKWIPSCGVLWINIHFLKFYVYNYNVEIYGIT